MYTYWYTKMVEYLNWLLHKKRAHGKYLQLQNENDKIKYERQKRETKRMIRRSKKDLEILQTKQNLTPKNFTPYVIIFFWSYHN